MAVVPALTAQPAVTEVHVEIAMTAAVLPQTEETAQSVQKENTKTTTAATKPPQEEMTEKERRVVRMTAAVVTSAR